MADDGPSARPDIAGDPLIWPVVTPGNIVIADFEYDLAYMGVYLRLEICNRSPYLVREAELRVDGRGQKVQKIVTSETITVGPLFPGVHVHEEVGIGAQEGISGVAFESVAASAVGLTPPSDMVPAGAYPGLLAEIVEVTTDEEALDLRWSEDDHPPTTVATSIYIRVRNTGPAVVERARFGAGVFEAGADPAGGQAHSPRDPVAEWILDMPRADWNPYRLPAAPHAFCRSRGSPAARRGPRVHACPPRRRTSRLGRLPRRDCRPGV